MKASNIKYCPEYFYRYIHKTDDLDFKILLQLSLEELNQTPIVQWEAIGDKVYAEGKWTIKQILQHLIDTERIFTYRALAFARKDKEIIPPFDENEYTEAAQVSHRSLADLLDEYKNVRKSLQSLYLSFTPEMLQNTGKMTSGEISVLAFPFILAGHQRWHFEIIEKRYAQL